MNFRLVHRTCSDADLIRRAKRGDAAAFSELYNQNKRRVYSLCLRMVSNQARAEELTQDTFLQVYRKLKTFRGDSAFSTWLHRIAVNVVLMALRRAKSRATEVSLDQPLDSQDEQAPREAFGAPDPRLTSSIDRVNLERAISNLPPGYGLVFVLHDIEGYQHGEIAELLGCSVGNTKSQLHKARMKLRKCLHGELQADPAAAQRRMAELQEEIHDLIAA